MPHVQVIRDGAPPKPWLARAIDTLRSTLSLKDPELARKLGWGGGPTAAGVEVNVESALGCAPVASAVSLISGDASTLPLHVFRRTPGGGRERDNDHPLADLLRFKANSEMSAPVAREAWVGQALVYGSGYCEIERDAARRPVALAAVPPTVRPFRERGVLRHRVAVVPSGDDVFFDPGDLLILHGPTLDGITGLDPVRRMRETLALSLAAERFGSSFFGNGTAFGGALKHPKTLGLEAQKTLRESLDATHRGADKAHRFLILEEGMDFTRFGVDPESAQFLETRRFQIAEVARFFKIPVGLLGDLERSTFSNQEQQVLSYVTQCLRGWLVKIETEMMIKLFSVVDRRTRFIEHELSGLLRGDTAGRAAYYGTMLGAGVLTPNEVRRLENFPDVPNGNDLIVPLNKAPLATLTHEAV